MGANSYLVTGGTDFIGGALVKNFSGKGFKGKYIVPLPNARILANDGTEQG